MRRRESGFSFLELLVAIIIIGGVLFYCSANLITDSNAFTKASQVEAVKEYALNLLDELQRSPFPISELPKTETWNGVTIRNKYYDVERRSFVKETTPKCTKIMIEVDVTGREKKEKVTFSKMIVTK